MADARSRGAMKGFPGLSVSLISFTPDLGRMLVQTCGPGEPGTYWLVKIATLDAKSIS
jgi:hypothetical protein